MENFVKETGKVCAVFTSPQGVKHFFEQLRTMQIDMRKLLANQKLQIAAIGAGTKKELEHYNLFVDYMPERYYAKELGNVLGQQLEADTKVYIFRALEGSEELTKELDRAKLEYVDVATYETVYESNPHLIEKLEDAFQNEQMDMVTFTSASTVKGFVNTMKNIDFTKVQAICIGEQTAREAEKYHMHIKIAQEPSMESMVQCICE